MSRVSIVKTNLKYPSDFYPPNNYPEFSEKIKFAKYKKENHIYAAVRKSLHLLNFDGKNFGQRNWNPLKYLIKKGDTVLNKTNLVRHYSGLKNGKLEELITNSSIIRAIFDYVALALEYEGTIIIYLEGRKIPY
ncbi:MAG: hypothetical protein HZR80_13735 [Candidatus Heimdallarchaeota archaeon]